MSDVPEITLHDERTVYDKQAGAYRDYLPVEIRVETEDEAREVARVFTEAWKAEKGDSDE